MNKVFQKILLIVFFITLLIESYAIYTRHIMLYNLSSVSIAPIMLFYGFSITRKNFTQISFYLFMLLSWAADLMTISFSSTKFYIGLSLYSFSYMMLGAIFYKILTSNKKNYLPKSYYYIALILFIIIVMFSLNSGYPDIIMKFQELLHIYVLVTITFWSYKLRKNKIFKQYFIPGVIIILLSNLLYAVDILVLHQKYPLVDSMDVFLYGLYLFLITNGIIFFRVRKDKPPIPKVV